MAIGRAAPVLALYRSILRVHRAKLPPPMRDMGDRYLRDEFQRHLRGSTTAEQWQAFSSEWQRYRGMLAGAADLSADGSAFVDGDAIVGGLDRSGEMQDEALRAMSPEQRDRLERLRLEALRLGRSLLGAKPIQNNTNKLDEQLATH